ncbi:MAG: MBL fold metallo-hydrolase [Patescibacteria group bacterium]|nr:MBL fold metallo-hydrolase [Patescibacteria group bacterium]
MKVKQLAVGELAGNCYLLASENELIVIDPGDEAERILKEIEQLKAIPKYIIITHCHPDHVLAMPEIKKQTGAKVLIHEQEKQFGNCEADGFLKEKDEIKIGNTVLKVIHTPGHTPGSICLLGDNFIFTGDTLFENGYGRTDLPGGSYEEMENSLNRLSQLLKSKMVVYPGHGRPFDVKK